MYRFYYPTAITSDEFVITDKNEVHHIKNVLRYTPSDKIQIFNNTEEITGEILSITPKQVKIKVCKQAKHNAKTTHIILACAIPKKSKFEFIIEKATELGADEILPLKTARTEFKLTEDRLSSKLERYKKIAVNAAKQCQRVSIPQIYPPITFSEALEKLNKNTTLIIPSLEKERKNIFESLSYLKDKNRLAVFIGPEGDFTKEEYAQAREAGAIAVSLGNNVLRVETAAISALSCINALINN